MTSNKKERDKLIGEIFGALVLVLLRPLMLARAVSKMRETNYEPTYRNAQRALFIVTCAGAMWENGRFITADTRKKVRDATAAYAKSKSHG